MKDKDKDKIIELGGRQFRAIENSTVEHDFTVMQLLSEAGLNVASQREGESYEDFAMRLLSQVIRSGQAFELIGTFIMEADCPDEDWTPESGRQIAKFISKLTAQDDKLQIRQLSITLLAGFAEAGLFSFTSSSAVSTDEPAAPRPEAPQQQPPSMNNSTTRLPPGASSSARSPAPIRPGTVPWLAALWRRLFGRTATRSAATRATISR